MKKDKDTTRFKGWPFAAQERREDGEINNGAFDLVQHPEKIEAIHEATAKNGLQPLLIYLNRPDGDFLTLGCSSGLDGNYYAYIEFTIRDAALAMNTGWPQVFERQWNRYLDRADSQFPGIAHWLKESCQMEWRHFHLRPEIEPRLLVTLYPVAIDETEFCKLMSHIQRFFELLESRELD